MPARAKKPTEHIPSGIPVDASGGPTIDPTANVIALSEASNRRQDDLRTLNDRRIDSEIARLDTEICHVKEMAALREQHAKEIGAAESNRLNSIRQVDVLAVTTAAERALAGIQTLAVTTASNAENLRNALNTTASTIATQTAGTVAAITERIAALEKSSYEGIGKQRYSDPAMAQLVEEMRGLRESRAGMTGKSAGVNMALAALATVAALVMTAIGILVTFMVVRK